MRPALLLLCASSLFAAGLRFDIADAKGKKPGGVSIEASEPDEDGWSKLKLQSKGKGTPVLVWPFDDKAKAADGPGEIPAVVIDAADPKALANPKVIALLLARKLLGSPLPPGVGEMDFDKSAASLNSSEDPFTKGVALLFQKKPAEASDLLGRALKERERQLTRVPSEVYPAAMLYGESLLGSGKYDDAALAFLKALKQRPSDATAARLRSEALEKAGKPEAR